MPLPSSKAACSGHILGTFHKFYLRGICSSIIHTAAITSRQELVNCTQARSQTTATGSTRFIIWRSTPAAIYQLLSTIYF